MVRRGNDLLKFLQGCGFGLLVAPRGEEPFCRAESLGMTTSLGWWHHGERSARDQVGDTAEAFGEVVIARARS